LKEKNKQFDICSSNLPVHRRVLRMHFIVFPVLCVLQPLHTVVFAAIELVRQ
jgi:hypothetical protein